MAYNLVYDPVLHVTSFVHNRHSKDTKAKIRKLRRHGVNNVVRHEMAKLTPVNPRYAFSQCPTSSTDNVSTITTLLPHILTHGHTILILLYFLPIVSQNFPNQPTH
jgi:hypothetical protein